MNNSHYRTIVYVSSALYALCVASYAYLTSTVLYTLKTPQKSIDYFYVAVAVIGIAVLFIMYKKAQYCARNTLRILAITIVTCTGLIFFGIYSYLPTLVLCSLGILIALEASMYSTLDRLLEHYSPNTSAGSVRSTYLAIQNSVWVAGALLGVYISKTRSLTSIAILFLVISVITLIIISNSFLLSQTNTSQAIQTTHQLSNKQKKEVLSVFLRQFILQSFYAIMIVYIPILFLSRSIPLVQQGLVMAGALCAFPMVQFQLARYLDNYRSPKLLQIIGFSLMLAVGITIALYGNYITILGFLGLLFASRIGAALVETVNEFELFRTIDDTYKREIYQFRSIAPSSYVLIGILGVFGLGFTNPLLLFYVLTAICGVGVIFTGVMIFDQKQ